MRMKSFTGFFTTIRWLITLERQPYTTRKLKTIERLQAWSILIYYPLEHISYLLNHALIPSEVRLTKSVPSTLETKARGTTIKLDSGSITRASIGFWGIYTVLQLVRLRDDIKEVNAKARLVNKSKVLWRSARSKLCLTII